MPLNKQAILKALQAHGRELRTRFSVKSIGLFGSYARGEQKTKSDIDLLVEFEQTTFDNYMDLKFFLENLFQAGVDIVLADAVKPRLKPYIEREVIYAQGL